ncbi:MAG TPA: T9SS type A sorting domain-containing protein [Cytophagales bacterium]|nr:T9SS type A sorting domain-containing protein [Cytophagales bacterium]
MQRYINDEQGNILARDSAYLHYLYSDGELQPYHGYRVVFDTVAYHGFKDIDDFITSTYEPHNATLLEPYMYPNPAEDHVWIQGGEADIWQLYTTWGTLVLEVPIQKHKQQYVDLAPLDSGLYIAIYKGLAKRLIIN